GFTLVGVNVENNPEGAKKWLADNGPVTFPVLLDTKNEVSKLYKVETMPSTVVIAKDGSMRFVHHGYKAGYEGDYQNEVRQLLREYRRLRCGSSSNLALCASSAAVCSRRRRSARSERATWSLG